METWYSMSLPATFRVEMTGLEILHQNLSGKYTFGLMNPVWPREYVTQATQSQIFVLLEFYAA